VSHADASSEPVELIVSDDEAGLRLDAFLARRFTHLSRVHLRKLINAAAARVDGRRQKAAYHLRAGQQVIITLGPAPKELPLPEDIPLEILYEDDDLAAINKPPGMVVHPGKGNWQGTLTSALQFHFDALSGAGGPSRPGIVHRLDRDTSGVIVVAKNDPAHFALAAQFEHRQTEKEYFALVAGSLDRDRDRIEQPIAPHPTQREKMAIRREHSAARAAETFYEVEERFRGFAALKVFPKTGRTHQIRVHLAHIGCPVLCDRLYGGRAQITCGELTGARDEDRVILNRQALHARRLRLLHPTTGEPIELTAPLPADLLGVLELLRQHRSE